MQFTLPLHPTSVYERVSESLRGRGWKSVRSSRPTPGSALVLHALNQDVPWPQLSNGQLVNFYRGVKSLTNKANLAKALAAEGKTGTVAPSTHCLLSGSSVGATGPGAGSVAGSGAAAAAADEREALILDHAAAKGRGEDPVWIAKSSVGAKGENIKISRNPMELIDHIDRISNGKAWVVQR